MRNCQSFRQGCCGCCVNMRRSPEWVRAFLEANTRAWHDAGLGDRPRFRGLILLHWRRGGWRDHLLVTILAPITLGLTAWLWMRLFGSCCFAGILDSESGRVGCLIHPQRVGEPDLRRHAFPGVPLLGCDRALRCPMLDLDTPDLNNNCQTVSAAGFWSLRRQARRSAKI